MSGKELKPCPFCGGDVSFHKDEECPGCHLIQCGQCRAFFDFATGADPGNDCDSVDALRSAIAPMWNRRAKLYTTPQPSAVPAGWKLVPVEPTPEMVSAAEEAHMPFGDMDIALRMAILSAPSAPATVPSVNQQLLEALNGMLLHIREPESESEFQWPEHFKKQKAAFAAAHAAIAAARKGEV